MIVLACSAVSTGVAVIAAVISVGLWLSSIVRRPVRQEEPHADYLVRELARRTGRDENVVRQTLQSVGALPEEGMETERRWTP